MPTALTWLAFSLLMTDYNDLYGWQNTKDLPADVYEKDAREHLRPFFEQHRERVFFSRNLRSKMKIDISTGSRIEQFEILKVRD